MTNPDNVGGLPELPTILRATANALRCQSDVQNSPYRPHYVGAVSTNFDKVADVIEDAARALSTHPSFVCDFCGKDYSIAAYCCQKRREYMNAHGHFELCRAAPAGGDDWPFLEEIGRDGKPTGYWIRKGSPVAARMSAPAGSGEVEEVARQMEAMAEHIHACSPEQKAERLRGWASMLRALSRGVPEGMVLVPIEPTSEMETAHRMYGDTSDWWQTVITAAIAAQRKEG